MHPGAFAGIRLFSTEQNVVIGRIVCVGVAMPHFYDMKWGNQRPSTTHRPMTTYC